MYRTVGRNPLPKGANGIPIAGEWYSVPAGGECAVGARLGDGGCTWRLLRTRKRIRASCMCKASNVRFLEVPAVSLMVSLVARCEGGRGRGIAQQQLLW